jgi:hypothetical protein
VFALKGRLRTDNLEVANWVSLPCGEALRRLVWALGIVEKNRSGMLRNPLILVLKETRRRTRLTKPASQSQDAQAKIFSQSQAPSTTRAGAILTF